MSEEYGLEDFAPWLVVLITLMGGFLRVLLLARNGMWLDETFSVWLANHSVNEMLEWIVRIDQHPPLYYLLLHYWIALNGDTPYYARFLSVLFGVGTIPVIYLIGKRISGAVTGLAAAILLSLSLFNIAYAQEARMYTLLTFNASAAIYALVRLLTDARSSRPIGSQVRDYVLARRSLQPPNEDATEEFSYGDWNHNQTGWRARIFGHRRLPIRDIETDLAWIALIFFSAATMLTHNTAVFFLLSINIFVFGLMFFQRMQKTGSLSGFHAPSLGNWIKAQVAIFLLWSPWLFTFIQQASRVTEEFWIPKPTWDSVTQVLITFLNGYRPRQSSYETMIWVLYGLVLCLAMLHYRKHMSRFLLLTALFAIPFLGELIVSIRRPIFLDRTLIWTTIPLFVLLGAGIAQLRSRFLIVLGIGILGMNSMFSSGDYYRFFQKEDWATAAGYVALFAEQDDLVLFNSNFVEIPFDYYFETYEEGYAIQVEKSGVPLDLFRSGVLEPRMTTNDIPGLIALISNHDRVWLVYSHDSYTDPVGLIPQTLASQMRLIRTHEFYGGKVQLYVNP